MSEHETDLLRDHPELQPLVVGEIFNDPRAEERSSQDMAYERVTGTCLAPSAFYDRFTPQRYRMRRLGRGRNDASRAGLERSCAGTGCCRKRDRPSLRGGLDDSERLAAESRSRVPFVGLVTDRIAVVYARERARTVDGEIDSALGLGNQDALGVDNVHLHEGQVAPVGRNGGAIRFEHQARRRPCCLQLVASDLVAFASSVPVAKGTDH